MAGVELQDDDIEVEVAEVEEGTELLDAQAKGDPHDEPEASSEDEDGEEEEEYDYGDDEEEAYGEEKDAGSEQNSELLSNPLFKLFIVILFLVLFFLLVNGHCTN